VQDGQIIQRGSPEEIYHHPVNEYCAGLFGAYNLVDPSIVLDPFRSLLPKGKKLFFRPEDVEISTDSAGHSFEGIIRNIRYWGSFYTLEISAGKEMISVQMRKPGFSKGDHVYLTLSKDSVAYL
ncbi:MAG: TOBE domain-containing protein, partial [Chitinophagaceae bacterium]